LTHEIGLTLTEGGGEGGCVKTILRGGVKEEKAVRAIEIKEKQLRFSHLREKKKQKFRKAVTRSLCDLGDAKEKGGKSCCHC